MCCFSSRPAVLDELEFELSIASVGAVRTHSGEVRSFAAIVSVRWSFCLSYANCGTRTVSPYPCVSCRFRGVPGVYPVDRGGARLIITSEEYDLIYCFYRYARRYEDLHLHIVILHHSRRCSRLGLNAFAPFKYHGTTSHRMAYWRRLTRVQYVCIFGTPILDSATTVVALPGNGTTRYRCKLADLSSSVCSSE